MARFTLPRDLYHGKGALEALKSFTGKKAMICVGGGCWRVRFIDHPRMLLRWVRAYWHAYRVRRGRRPASPEA